MGNILFVGDSRCVGLSNGSGQNGVKRAKSMSVDGKKVPGVDGEDSNGNFWFCRQNKTLKWVESHQKEIDAMAKESEVVVFVMGGNDPNPTEYANYLKKLKVNPLYKGKQIFFVGIPPRKAKASTEAARKFNKQLKAELPKGVTFVDLEPCFKKYNLENNMATDGIHFDGKANQIMYDYVMKQIEEATRSKTKIAFYEDRENMENTSIVLEKGSYHFEGPLSQDAKKQNLGYIIPNVLRTL